VVQDKKLYYYKGNYDDFKEMHRQKVEKQLKDWEKQQKMLKAMKTAGKSSKDAKDKAIAQAKRGTATTGKTAKASKGAGGASMGTERSAEDRGDGGADEDGLIARPKEYTVRFDFDDPPELAPPVLSVTGMGFRYGEKYPWLFKDVDFGIDQSSRIAIVGPNGVGACSAVLHLNPALAFPRRPPRAPPPPSACRQEHPLEPDDRRDRAHSRRSHAQPLPACRQVLAALRRRPAHG
jgi:ATPase subunit of ABC transporter with duplicated ATPase domains